VRSSPILSNRGLHRHHPPAGSVTMAVSSTAALLGSVAASQAIDEVKSEKTMLMSGVHSERGGRELSKKSHNCFTKLLSVFSQLTI
jgi:hypothetical protein